MSKVYLTSVKEKVKQGRAEKGGKIPEKRGQNSGRTAAFDTKQQGGGL